MAGRILNNKEQKRLPFPIVGKVKIGELATSSTGKQYPRSCEWFIPSGDYAPLFKQAYGEKPSTIQIVFPTDDAELVCREEYVLRDNAGKLVATGDGETFRTWSEKAQKYIMVSTAEQPDIMAMLEKHYKQEWKITLTLVFILPLVRGVMGCWQFQTKGSASTIPQVRDAFDAMIEQNGKAAGVIFDLSVKIHKSNKPNDTSKYPVVTLVPNESQENLQKVHDARKPIALIDAPENAKK
jgi:hypothetical protein